MDGLEFLGAVQERYLDLPFILFTGKGSEEIASEAISAGVTDYLQKESGIDQSTILANRVEDAVSQRRAKRRMERGYQTLEAAREGVCLLDADGRFTYVNEAHAELFGYEPGELHGEHWERLYPAEDADRLREEAFPQVCEEGSWSGEVTGQRADGSTVPTDHLLSEATDGSLICIVHDITDRKRRERERERSRRYRRDLYELLSEPDLAFEEKRRRLLELGCERLGLADGKLVRVDREAGTHESVTVARERSMEGEQVDLAQTYCRHIAESRDLLAVNHIGESDLVDDRAYENYEHECYIGAPVTVGGDLYGNVCFYASEPRAAFTEAETTFVELVARGLSHELKRHRLETERERYERIVETSPDGIAIVDAEGVSHDLRNPFTVAEGRLQTAKDSGFEPVERAHARMKRMIGDVLELARQNRNVEEPEPVDVGDAAETAWRTVETENAELQVTADTTLEADPERLRTALENLYRNAVEHGGSEVTVTVGSLDTGFYVEDEGEGIPADERDDVLESGYSTGSDGTGLGLAIVRHVVAAHGWEIRVTESDAGGARFEIRT